MKAEQIEGIPVVYERLCLATNGIRKVESCQIYMYNISLVNSYMSLHVQCFTSIKFYGNP